MTGEELRKRINRLGLTYVEAARQLGLTEIGLHHQMRGERKVSRQTELLLEVVEQRLRGSDTSDAPTPARQ